MLLVLAVPLVCAIALTAQHESTIQRKLIAQTSLAFAKLFAARLDDQIGVVKSLGAAISHVVKVAPTAVPANNAFLSALASDLPASVISIGVWDDKGRNLGILDPNPVQYPFNIADTDYFSLALTSDKWIITGPSSSRSSAVPTMQFAKMLHDEVNHSAGVVTLTVEITRLQTAVSSKGAFPAETVTTVINPDGLIIATSERFSDFVGKAVPSGMRDEVIVREGSRVGSSSIDGVQRVWGFASMSEAPWRVYVGTPLQVVDADATAASERILAIGLTIVVFTILAAFLLARSFIRPLRQLSLDAERLGDSNAEWTSQVDGPPEVRAISLKLGHAAKAVADREAILRNNKAWLRKVTDAVPLLLSYVDAAGYFRFVNRRHEYFLGLGPTDLIGRKPSAALSDPLLAVYMANAIDALKGKPRRFEYSIEKPDGKKDILVDFFPDTDDGVRTLGFFGIHQDVSALKDVQRTLQRNADLLLEAKTRLRTITDNLPALVCYINKDWKYEFANATYQKWMDSPSPHLEGRAVADVFPNAFRQIQAALASALSGTATSFEIELPRSAGRSPRWFRGSYVPDRDADGTVLGVYGMSRDITAEKELEIKLAQLATIDSLTGLPNRREFDRVLAERLRAGVRAGISLTIIFADVDHFKRVNDSYGHAAGDQVLNEIGRRLRSTARSQDFVARISGDEFVVLLDDLETEDTAIGMAKGFLSSMIPPVIVGTIAVHVSVSLGVARHLAAPITPSELLRMADDALYEAKAKGRATYAVSRRTFPNL